MSVDREFRFLNETRNSLIDWNNSKISINEWKDKPYKTSNSVKNSTMKYIVPILMLTFWWINISKESFVNSNYDENKKLSILKDKNIHYYSRKPDLLTEVPDALRVTPKIMSQKAPIPTTLVSGEFFWEKTWEAPWEKHIYKTWAEYTYLFLYKKLSFEEYDKLFNGFVNVKQWWFWDCYLISTIKSLARSRYFDTLMMTSIENDKDGSYNIYFPLWNPNWKKIHISKEELKLAKIKWSLWYKILEIWFSKEMLFRSHWSLLYLWDMPDIKLTKESMNCIVWWNSFYALATLLWYENIRRQTIANIPERKDIILKELNKFDPKNLDLIIVSSNRRPKNVPNSQKTYIVDNETMYYHHAYSVYAVEKRWNFIHSVILEDPANNKRKIKLSLFGFMSSFFGITTCSPKEWFLSIV